MFKTIVRLPESGMTLTTISEKLGMSYQKVYNIYQQLLEDLKEINPEMDVDSNPSNIYEVFSKSGITLDNYRLYLTKNSIVFRAFDYGFTNANSSFDQFVIDNFLSKSTLLRKMQTLRKELKKYNLSLSTSDLKLQGSEKSIRLFVYYVYWIAYHGQEWPFDNVQKQTIVDILSNQGPKHSNHVKNEQEILYLAVCRIRIVSKNYLENDSRIENVFPNNQIFSNIVDKSIYPQLTSEQIVAENEYFALFVKVILKDSNPKSEDNIFNSLNDTNPANLMVEAFIGYLQEIAEKNDEHISRRAVERIKYTTLQVSSLYYIYDGNFPKITDFLINGDTDDGSSFIEKTDTFGTIKGFFDRYLPSDIVYSNQYSTFPFYIYQFNRSDLNSISGIATDNLKIYLFVDDGNLLEDSLNFYLNDIYFITTLRPDSNEKPDVIVSTIASTDESNPDEMYDCETFYWNIDSNFNVEFEWLVKELKYRYVKKIQDK